MKKLLFILVIIILIAGGGLWYGYYRLLPKMVGKAIVENTEPDMLPEPVKAKISKLRKPVNRAAETLFKEIDSLKIPFAAILRLIDETQNENVVAMIQELQKNQPDNANTIFDIVKRNIPSREFDLEHFRKPFVKYATMDRYEYGMRYIEKNQVVEQIDDMPYREIVKEVLLQKRAELDRRLKDGDGPKLN